MMCIEKEEFMAMKSDTESISKRIDEHIKSHKTLNKTITGFLLANVFLLAGGLIYIGSWKTKVEMSIESNKELMAVRTEDRFFRQDGDVLETKINNVEDRQERIENQFNIIDAKLDRLIES